MLEISKYETISVQQLPTADLQALHQKLFGLIPDSNNRKFLERKVTYRLQELAHGGIGLEIQNKIQKMIASYDPINKSAGKTKSNDPVAQRDNRLPIPGSLISKVYKGKKIDVKVLESGFEHDGIIYKNLSAVAKAITGSHWNGFIFFGFRKP